MSTYEDISILQWPDQQGNEDPLWTIILCKESPFKKSKVNVCQGSQQW